MEFYILPVNQLIIFLAQPVVLVSYDLSDKWSQITNTTGGVS